MIRSAIYYAAAILALVSVSCGWGSADRTDEAPVLVAPIPAEPVVQQEPAPTQSPHAHAGDESEVQPSNEPAVSLVDKTVDPQTGVVKYKASEKPWQSYYGNAELEERIAAADIIVLARLSGVVAGVEVFDPDDTTGHGPTLAAVLKFTFNVSKYLKGTGSTPGSLTAVVRSLAFFDTRERAQALADHMLAERDTQWDNRDSVIFLVNESATLPATAPDDVYFMSIWDTFDAETGDQYSIASNRNKVWLPEAQSAAGGGRSANAERRFLTDVPATQVSGRSGGQTANESPAITQSDLAAKITSVTNKLNAQPGRAYQACVLHSYSWDRIVEYFRSQNKGYPVPVVTVETELASGLPANTNTDRLIHTYFVDENWKGKDWFEGDDADLFAISDDVHENRTWPYPGTIENSFSAVGGKFKVDTKLRIHYLSTTRPLPAGEYTFTIKQTWPDDVPCRDEDYYSEKAVQIVKVTAPDGTLHEALFDPVTDGSAVAADATNGQLEPAAFTDANGAAATIQRIEWASDTVKVSPHTGLAGHRLDFIELDGTVSLSLAVDDATVDAANRTLSWTVAEQPWEDGDLLMLRIKETDPEIALIDVPGTLAQGEVASFTVQASGLSSADSYRVRLSLDNEAVGFGNGCGTVSRALNVPLGNTSFSTTESLYGCVVSTDTLTATLELGGVTVATATAELEVEASSNVTLSLSPRQEQNVTYTDLSVGWNDPGECAGNYFVAVYRSNRTTVIVNLGVHPAPETTMLSANTSILWNTIPNHDWWVKVSCTPTTGNWTEIGEASLQSGLPSESGSE